MTVRRPLRAPRDEGYTLVETLITVLVVSIVMIAAFPVLPVFFRESNIVQNTYQSVDQLVLASEVATRYIHEAVAPSPTANPILNANANNTTFYANTGDPNGPQQVVMQVATSGSSRTLQVNLYSATAGTCPGINVNGAGCTYTGSTQSYLLINYLTNGTGGSPVFTYTLQGGQVCGGPPPASPTATLNAATTSATTSLNVASLPNPVTQGDTIFLGAGPNAPSVTATASVAKSASPTTIPVTAVGATVASGTGVYDTAITNAPNTVPTTLTSSTSTTLVVPSLYSAVAQNDIIVIGTGASAQTVTATSATAATNGSPATLHVATVSGTPAAGSSIYDSSCSLTQVSQIQAVSLSLLATKNPGGQPTGYQSLAYFLSPGYSSSVG